MKSTTIFITYNPKVADEQTLAIRLHSIGAVSGFRMYLPDRYNSDSELDIDTKLRIDAADYVIIFALTPTLSGIVQQEIEYAYSRLQDKSKIIVIYSVRKTLKGKTMDHFTEIYHNTLEETADTVIERILKTIFDKEKQEQTRLVAIVKKQAKEIKRLQSEKESQNALIALLGIGLGLAILSNTSKSR
jgi:hypothetical protein